VWAGDPVEEGPERPARGHPHVLGRLVAEELQHHELRRREPRHAPGERYGVGLELGVGHDLEDHADLGGRAGGDGVAGQEIALGPLEAHPVDPHRRRRGPPDAGRRVAEGRALGRDDQVGAQHHVRAAPDAPALHRGERRLSRVPELHVGVDEASDHPQVGDRVPDAAALARMALAGLRSGGPVEAVARAEGCALGAQQDHAHLRVRVGGVDRRRELVAQPRRDRVVGLRPAEHDLPHAIQRLGPDRLHGSSPGARAQGGRRFGRGSGDPPNQGPACGSCALS